MPIDPSTPKDDDLSPGARDLLRFLEKEGRAGNPSYRDIASLARSRRELEAWAIELWRKGKIKLVAL